MPNSRARTRFQLGGRRGASRTSPLGHRLCFELPSPLMGDAVVFREVSRSCRAFGYVRQVQCIGWPTFCRNVFSSAERRLIRFAARPLPACVTHQAPRAATVKDRRRRPRQLAASRQIRTTWVRTRRAWPRGVAMYPAPRGASPAGIDPPAVSLMFLATAP